MLKRKRKGNPSCYFYDGGELSNQVFFECKVAKANRGLIACLIGAINTRSLFPLISAGSGCEYGYQRRHGCVLLTAAICSSMWKNQNRASFDKKKD
jgi:hypothetical protein